MKQTTRIPGRLWRPGPCWRRTTAATCGYLGWLTPDSEKRCAKSSDIEIRSHLRHRFLVILEDPLPDHFSNDRSVHEPGSSTPMMVIYFSKLLISFHSPMSNHTNGTDALSKKLALT
uniref:Secreted protein n=1 Tax=Heterorhabditis bacteriophora TaxID=37862 RepID=A0A1I7WN41_HETBA